MMNTKDLINRLLPMDNILSMSGEDIVGHIAINIYGKEYAHLRKSLDQVPIVFRDIVLLINLDTELSMNGILGFLENPSGAYFDQTIDALERILADKDFNIMKSIKNLLNSNGINVSSLRTNVNNLEEFQVSSFSRTHGRESINIINSIEILAGQLYLYRDDNDLFEYLFKYVEVNKVDIIGLI
ncbi:DMP19 family protein [Paenibacillus sp. CAU 1782]